MAKKVKSKKRNLQDLTLIQLHSLKLRLDKYEYEQRAFKRQCYLQKVILPRSKWEMPVWENRVKK